MTLFQLGDFTLRSGQKSSWKIECDSLTPDDWEALAKMASEILPRFGMVHGVPRGGIPFAKALQKYGTRYLNDPMLIAEDVVTTGGSMERFIEGMERKDNIIGIAVFARGKPPDWVTALFPMGPS